MKVETIQTFCQHCHMKCRLSIHVKDGKIETITNKMGIEGIKAIHSQELLYHPDRVTHPLKRNSEKGEGKWESISWDEALDIMAKRFGEIKEEYGGEAIGTVLGCGHKEMASIATFLFSHIIGTPNILDINHLCSVPLGIAGRVTFGESIISDIGPHFRYSKCILLWGANPKHNRPPLERDINLAQAEGAKLIVVDPRPPERLDPRRLGLAPADIWLRVRPGTDAALALGMIRAIIDVGLYDKAFVDRWCVGFDELKRRVQQYPLERVAQITWIPREKITEAARLFATTKPSCLHARLGPGAMQINATQTSRAIAILVALTGNIDIQGGNLIPDKLGGFRSSRWMYNMPVFLPGVEEKRLGAKRFPLIAGSRETAKGFEPFRHAHNPTCIQAMLKGDIKALFIPGSNVVMSEGDSKRTWAALKNLQFLVVADFFMTPTAELADLVLPAAHFLETDIPMRAYQSMGSRYQNYILAARRVARPAGECWDDRKIVLELAKRMNVETPWQNIEQFNDWQLEEVGIKFNDILKKTSQVISFPSRYKKYEQEGFNTPSGKIELYSSVFKNLGYDPLPHYIEPPQSPISTPDIAKEYPFILITHRTMVYMHSEFRQIPSLRRVLPEPLIEINPDTATGLGIEEGDEVYVERPGFEWQVKAKAKFVPELHPQVVSCLSHWWFPEKSGPEHGCFESNINSIISTNPPYDPVNGNPQMRAILCRVGKNVAQD